jgi:hypothetical protein
MSGVSYISPLAVALVTAVEGDVTLAGLLAGSKIYSGLAPEESPFNYVTLTGFTEAEKSLFGKQGTQGVVYLNIWTQGQGEMMVLGIYEALYALLHNTKLAISRGRQIQGKMRLILTGVGGTSDPTIVRGVAEYTMRAVS